MNKNNIKVTLAVILAISLSACSSSCSTKEDVKAKAEEMVQKFQDLAKSGDMSKIMTLTTKMQSLQKLGSSQDPQAACKAMDELMGEL